MLRPVVKLTSKRSIKLQHRKTNALGFLSRNRQATHATPPRFYSTDTTQNQEGVKKVKIYTKTGDGGTTSLFNGERRSKTDPIFNTLGALDELGASLGVVRGIIADKGDAVHDEIFEISGKILQIQKHLFDVCSHVATPLTTSSAAHIKRTDFPGDRVTFLENDIDSMELKLPPLTQFIIPGGSQLSAQIHVCRSICRRSERLTISVSEHGDISKSVLMYLNRLSDWLFVAARVISKIQQEGEIPYKRRLKTD